MTKDPIRPTDDDARTLAQQMIATARHGALGTLQDGVPLVTRIALTPDGGTFLTLVSDLAMHTKALRVTPVASLLIAEPGKGDPLAHPRMTLQVTPTFIDKQTAADTYLQHQPKAQLYIGFADFHMVRLTPTEAFLNAGFGKAFRLLPADLVSVA